MEENIGVLDKSFIQQTEGTDNAEAVYRDSDNENQRKRDKNSDNDFNFFDSDDEGQFSGLLSSMNNHKHIPNMNFSTPTSNELNIFDSCESKYNTRSNFFRTVTRSNCEITNDENKKIIEKTMMYYRGGIISKFKEDNNNYNNNNNNIFISNNYSNLVEENMSIPKAHNNHIQ
jgi:hypothetical protein